MRLWGTWVTIPATMAKLKKKKVVRKATKRARKGGKASSGKLPKEAVTLIVHLRARDGQELLLEAELRALVAPTRKEEGCLVYDLHRSADGLGAFLFLEVWATREAHTAHTRTDHFLRWNARKDALCADRAASFWKKLL
jgi:quinol monooxygenase YgiN